MSPQYTITYFDVKGWAEPARMILSYGKADWKDNRIPYIAPGQSPIPDDIKERLRFGQVPLLEFDGKRLVQSMAICRYLAKQFGLNGKDDFAAAQVDEIVDACRDIFLLYFPHVLEKDEAKKAEGLKEAAKTTKQRFLTKFNEAAEAGGHLVGDNFTWADIMATCTLKQVEKLSQAQLLADFPALNGLVEKVLNAPGIKEYVAQRPDTLF